MAPKKPKSNPAKAPAARVAKAPKPPKPDSNADESSAVPQDVPIDPDVVSRNRQLTAMVSEAKTIILAHDAMSDISFAEPLKPMTALARGAEITEEMRLSSSTRAPYNAKECEVSLQIHKSYNSANNLFFIDPFSNPANYAAVSLARVEKLVDYAYKSPFESIDCTITACMSSSEKVEDKKGSLVLLSPQEDLGRTDTPMHPQ